MNTDISAAFQRLSWRAVFDVLPSSAALQAQARPADRWIDPPTIRDDDAPPRIWRYAPIGPRHRSYLPQ